MAGWADSVGRLAAGEETYDEYIQSMYLQDWYSAGEKVSDADRAKLKKDLPAQAFVGAWGGATSDGASLGSSAGPVGTLIGAIVGTLAGGILGIVDAVYMKDAVDIAVNRHNKTIDEIDAAMEQIGSFRDNIERQLSGLLNPLEQSYRTRARAFSRQATAQGLSGAQAIAASIESEAMYRNTIGPHLGSIIEAATSSGLAQYNAKLQAIELKYGITLAQEKQAFEREKILAEYAGSSMSSGISGVMKGAGLIVGSLYDASKDAKANDTTTSTGTTTGSQSGQSQGQQSQSAATTSSDSGASDMDGVTDNGGTVL